MDKGLESTQRIVIIVAIFLGISFVFAIGYSLYIKAKRAEGELANKIELDSQTKKETADANISLTGEARNSANFTYDGLVQKRDNTSTSTNFQIVDESVPVEIPEEEFVPEEEAVPPEPEEEVLEPKITKPAPPVDDDQPLTAEEIQRIRQLPIDDSPSGNLQTSLEEESNGQYKARY